MARPVHSILGDQSDRLWQGLDDGKGCANKDELTAVAERKAATVHGDLYTQADGLPAQGTSGRGGQPAACRTRDGRLWFATPNGIAVIDPSQIRTTALPPLVHLEEIRADSTVVFSSDPRGVSTTDPSSTRRGNAVPAGQPAVVHRLDAPLEIPARSAQFLEFRFAAISFPAPGACTRGAAHQGAGRLALARAWCPDWRWRARNWRWTPRRRWRRRKVKKKAGLGLHTEVFGQSPPGKKKPEPPASFESARYCLMR